MRIKTSEENAVTVISILVLMVAVVILFCAVVFAEEPVHTHGTERPIFLVASEPILSATPGRGFISGVFRFEDNTQRGAQFYKVQGGNDRWWSTGFPVLPFGVRHYTLIISASEFRDLAGNENDVPVIAHFRVQDTTPVAQIQVIEYDAKD